MGKLKFKFGGVNNVLDPAEVNERRDRFAPYTELVQGTDIDFSDRMAVRRRPGRTLLSLTNAHSLWATANKETAYFVASNGLYQLRYPTLAESLTTVLASNAPMAFVEVNDVVVFSNGTDLGCVVGGAVSPPSPTSKVGRIPTRAGVCLAFFNGRLYLASPDGVLYYTDPYDIDWMEEDNCRIPLNGVGTMVAPVDNGIWVSTATRLSFLRGKDASNFEWVDQPNYFAIPGASMVVPTAKLRSMQLPGEFAAVWASTNGICIGGADGSLINLSEDTYSYAPGDRGAILLRETEGLVHIVVSMQSGGVNYNQDSTSISPSRTRLN